MEVVPVPATQALPMAQPGLLDFWPAMLVIGLGRFGAACAGVAWRPRPGRCGGC